MGDIIGVSSVYAERELISALIAFYKSVGLTSADVVIKLNSRKVMQVALTSLCAPENSFSEVVRILDKLGKPGENTEGDLSSILGPDCAQSVMTLVSYTDFEPFADFAQLS